MTEASPRRPRTPATVRIAAVLIFVAIGYRLVLIFGSIRGLVEGNFVPPPGRLGQLGQLGGPLLIPFLVIGLVVVRKMMLRGHDWARYVFAGYVALRLLLIAVRGPWTASALGLAVLYLACLALLSSPSSNEWFLRMRSWRA